MPCWKCGHDSPRMKNAYKYCTECGARLVQDCMYCHQGMPVQSLECPHCGRALLRCKTHYILYDLEQERCEVPGCGEKLVYESDVFLPYGVSPSRANCASVGRYAGKLSAAHANAPISHLVANNTMGYYWKSVLGQSRLCCFDFAWGAPAWPDDACPTADFLVTGDSILNFEQSGVRLITSLSDKILINLLNDGKPVASVPVSGAYKAWMADNRLFVLSRGQGCQTLGRYAPPYAEVEQIELPQAGVDAEDEAVPVLAAVSGGRSFFVGFDGSLMRLDPGAASARLAYAPRNGARIGYLAVSGGYAVFSVLTGRSNNDDVYELRRLDVETLGASVIADNLHLAWVKFAVCGGGVFTCERASGGELYFYEYPLTGGYTTNPYINRYRISKASDIYDFFCASRGSGLHFFYISHSDSFNMMEAYRMGRDGSAERLRVMDIHARCGMVNIYNHTVLYDLNNGQIFSVETL